MFWKILMVIIALAVFTFFGGGRLIILGGQRIINLGEGMVRIEQQAKDASTGIVKSFMQRGEQKMKKRIEGMEEK